MPSRRDFVRSSASLIAAAWAPSLSAATIGAREKAVLALAQTYSAVRYFYPSDTAEKIAWDRFLLKAVGKALDVNASGKIGPMLQEVFGPIAPRLEIGREPFAPSGRTIQPDDVSWNHLGLGVGQTIPSNVYVSFRRNRPGESDNISPATGPSDATFPIAGDWHARMPIAMSSSEAAAPVRAPELPEWEGPREGMSREHILAAAIAMWAIAAQFYPHWDTVNVDWSAAFLDWMRDVPERADRSTVRRKLQLLTAKLVDGHAGIEDTQPDKSMRMLPLDVRPMDTGYVVTTSAMRDFVNVGDRIMAVNGRPIEDLRKEWESAISGSPQYAAWAGRYRLLSGEPNATATLRLQTASGERDVALLYDSNIAVAPERGDRELKPGIRFVHVPSFDKARFEQEIDDLARAKAIIFDLRGYPSRDAVKLAPFWLSRGDEPKWMHVPIRTRPFAPPDRYLDIGWNLKPDRRLEKAKKILLIDARAISYAESLTGVFVGGHAGTTVGEPTAGANGNVSKHVLPGGYTFRFTGMVVRDFDGKSIHARGFQPDVVVRPTVEGIRAGRDEVLEKAIEIAQAD